MRLLEAVALRIQYRVITAVQQINANLELVGGVRQHDLAEVAHQLAHALHNVALRHHQRLRRPLRRWHGLLRGCACKLQ